MRPAIAVIVLLATLIAKVVAEPPIDQEYFEPSNRVTGLVYPNPKNATCNVLMGIKQSGTLAAIERQPSATQIPALVDGNLTLQVENLERTRYEDGFELVVELPLTALISRVVNATLGLPTKGSDNETAAFKLHSPLVLEAAGANSQFVNTTVLAESQDFTPRQIYLNGSRCALAFAGFKPWKLPPTTPTVVPDLPPLPSLSSLP